jgi:hypothetical protein
MTALLLLVADTLLVRQVPPDRSGFEQAVFVAAGLAQIVTLVVVVVLTVIFFRLWKAQQVIQAQLGSLSAKVDPMIASATAAAENVRSLTDVVRKDAVLAADALAQATGRVRDSVGGIADRVDEFGELLGRFHAKTDAVAEVAGAALDTLKLGAHALRAREAQPRETPGRATPAHTAAPARSPSSVRPVDDDAHDEPIRLADGADDDSPYAEGAGETPRPARRRRRRRRGGGGSAPQR